MGTKNGEDRRTIIERIIRNEADMAYRRRVLTILEWLDPQDGDHILDGGCGRGFYLRFIKRVCQAKLVGVELEHNIARIAHAALSQETHLTLTQASLYDLPFSSDSFDKVILSEVLEHVHNDVTALRSVARVLKPDGLVAITVPNANYPFWWDPINKMLETIFDIHIQQGVFAGIWANHVRLYTWEQLRQTACESGLEIVDERAFTHHSFPFIHNIVYGFGKTVLEAGMLPKDIAAAADRFNTEGERGSLLNPVNLGLTLFEWFDRPNRMQEPSGRSTVNLCILLRKPLGWPQGENS